MMRAAFLVAALSAACATVAAAQGLTKCQLDARGGVSSDIFGNMEVARGGGGIKVNCPSRNIRLAADSGEIYGDDRVELYGKVHYEEAGRIDLRSDFLTYSMRDERIHVRGNVTAALPNGSTLTGPEATYLRAVPRIRTFEELTAVRNPTVTIGGRA